MGKKFTSILLILLLVLCSLPTSVMAAGTLILSASTASAGDTVTASGLSNPEAWVAVKVLDSDGSIVFYEQVKAGPAGEYRCAFKVPSVEDGVLKVIAGYGSNVATAELTVGGQSPAVHTVSVSANPSAGGTVSGGGTYTEGDAVTVTAAANSGYSFAGWTEGGIRVGTAASYTFTIGKANRTLTANFSPVSSGGGGSSSSGTSPAVTASVEANGFSKSVPVAVDGTSGSARASADGSILAAAFEKANADRAGIRKITVKMPEVQGVQSYSLELPAGLLSSQAADRAVEIKTGIAAMTVPGNMLAANAAGAKNVLLIIAAGDKTGLAVSVKAQIGGRPILELNLQIDGKQTFWNNPNAPVTVTVPYTPVAEELADPEHITVWYIDGSGKAVSVPSARYDPAMGKATFSTTHFSQFAVVFVQKNFSDIARYGWAKKPIEVLASKGIINGTGNDTYSPAANITRDDYLVMLIKTLGLATDFDGNFDDVASGTYYYEAVGIARKLGIATGVGNNKFNPKENISREDMMVLTARALEKFKELKATTNTTVLDKFSDKGDIAGYAVESLATLVKEGLISGSGDKLNPRAQTTRAEAAVFLYLIYNKY